MKHISYKTIDDIMFDYAEGDSLAKISRARGVSRPTIYRLLAQEGGNYENWKNKKEMLEDYRWENKDEILTCPHTGKEYRAIYEEIV